MVVVVGAYHPLLLPSLTVMMIGGALSWQHPLHWAGNKRLLTRSSLAIASPNRITTTASSSSLAATTTTTATSSLPPVVPSDLFNVHQSNTISRPFPRAAVSAVLRWQDGGIPVQAPITSSRTSTKSPSPPPAAKFLMIQRGKEPNKGFWSLPGGKIEWGESTLQAAKREVHEETNLWTHDDDEKNEHYTIYWHEKAFESTDSIIDGEDELAGEVAFHYVISQCFGIVVSEHLPAVEALDDAMDIKWLELEQIRRLDDEGGMTPGLLAVIERAELMWTHGFLDCVPL